MKGLAVAVVHKQKPAMGFGAFVGASQGTKKRGGRDAARRGGLVEGFVWEPEEAWEIFGGCATRRSGIYYQQRRQQAWQRWESSGLRLAFKR